jgi:hypothetical protein
LIGNSISIEASKAWAEREEETLEIPEPAAAFE